MREQDDIINAIKLLCDNYSLLSMSQHLVIKQLHERFNRDRLDINIKRWVADNEKRL